MFYVPVHSIFTLRYLYAHFTEKIEAQRKEVTQPSSRSKWDWKSVSSGGLLHTHWGVGMGVGDTASLSWLPALWVTSHLPCHLVLGLFTQVTPSGDG